MSALAGENAALRASQRLRDTKDVEAKLVTDALAKLSGWPVDDLTRADLAQLAASSGAKGLDAFVESYRRNTPKDPPRIHPDVAGTQTAPTVDCPEVAKFSDLGAAALAAARAAHEKFGVLSASGMRTPLDRFLQIEVDRALTAR